MNGLSRQLCRVAVFGCFGITVEVLFTALGDIARNYREIQSVDFDLVGHSSIWMFLIYGSAAMFVPLVYRCIRNYVVIVRMLIYAAAIFVVEYLAGWSLDNLLGAYPWKYEGAMTVSGYIRLDYVVFWMIFGLALERLYLLVERTLDALVSAEAKRG